MRLAALLCASMIAVGCDGQAPVQPVLDPNRPSTDSSGVTLSGGIFEVSADGTRRAIAARQVEIEVESAFRGWVPVGTDGRYRLSGLPDNRFVKVIQVDSSTTSNRNQYEFCATNTTIRGDTNLDVPLFLTGASLPHPTLSGQVFRVVDGQRVPVARADVYFRSRGSGPDVWTFTGADGRYSLCGLPLSSGLVYMFCGNDAWAYDKAVVVQEDVVLDIDATEFHRCLTFVV
jgi:hypothetical protein